jgi:hypothetical protein
MFWILARVETGARERWILMSFQMQVKSYSIY